MSKISLEMNEFELGLLAALIENHLQNENPMKTKTKVVRASFQNIMKRITTIIRDIEKFNNISNGKKLYQKRNGRVKKEAEALKGLSDLFG